MFQLAGVAVVPLNVTVPEEPKFSPAIVTDLPTGPDVGDRLLTTGYAVNNTPLLGTPLTVTTTFPVVAPLGTDATMFVLRQLEVVAAVPLNVTVPVDPKFVPVIVTDVPTPPKVGERLVMLGVGSTVKVTPLLAWPPTVTTTLPVVALLGTGTTMVFALQLVGDAATPLKVTVLVP
jgi:hypothetical protein